MTKLKIFYKENEIVSSETSKIIKCKDQKFEDNLIVKFVEEEDISIPTDLTEYQVDVPAGWSASAGYKELYSLNYDLYSYNNDSTYSSNTMLGIGFRGFDVDEFKFRFPVDNYIFTGQPTLLSFNNTDHLRFYFYGGKDVTNTNLIQWFVDNGATFTKIPHSGGA